MKEARLVRLDDLRRFAADLAERLGVAPSRASALATHLLWFDAAGAARLGIASLPTLLDALAAQKIDSRAVGAVGLERNGTAGFDGANGIPSLILARAAELATEKARDAGVGLVRVDRVPPFESAAGIVAEMAVGPYAGLALGPEPTPGAAPRCAVALPSSTGLPIVFDPALAVPAENAAPARRKTATKRPETRDALDLGWLAALRPDGGWLVAALSATAFGALAQWHDRVASLVTTWTDRDGRLLPNAWEARRRQAREHGVAIDDKVWTALHGWAGRLGVPAPLPASGPT